LRSISLISGEKTRRCWSINIAYLAALFDGLLSGLPSLDSRHALSKGNLTTRSSSFMQSDNSQARELKPEQKIAAHTLDRHLSVTAGPGAGKTFVLVERYLEILRAKKVSVDNIVAITFTNRAANEMRQRIRDRIDSLLRESSDRERQTWLRHKRTLEGSVITTIHGFCSRLLHEFPVEANIDPQFVLLDEHQAAMLLEAVVEEALADAIHRGSEIVLQFTQGTGRAAVANALVELHRKYRGEGSSLKTIERLTEINHSSQLAYARALKELDERMGELLSSSRLTRAAEEKRARAAKDWPALQAILTHSPTEKTIAAYTQAIEDFWDARPQKRSHPAIERIDELLWGDNPGVNDCLRGRLPAIGYDLLAKEYSLALLKLLREIDRRLDAEKQKLSVLDFDDLQLRALRLLDHPEVLARVSERYKFFLVDEFQDTNGLQRDLLTKLALMRGTNLFIVGDRKQSIYGFRGADVDVFSEMSNAIEKAGGMQQPLHLNFRSQTPLVNSLNFLFGKIFQTRTDVPPSALGQLGYVEHEPSIPLRGMEHEPPHVEFNLGIVSSSEDDAPDSSFRTNTFAAHQRDAEQVAARIQALVDAGSADVMAARERSRPEACVPSFRYGDIAILLRAFTGVWTYESALRRAGIPYLTVQGKGFYQREEITDLIQLLRFLDNTTDELALAAMLRSPLGGISDNALLALRCAPWIEEESDPTRLHRRNLLRAVRRHREIQFIDQTEHAALDRFHAWLESMIERRNRYGIADLLRYAVASSEFLPIIAANFDGAQRVANVEKLFRLAEQFEKSGHLIRDFVHYVEEFEAIGGREGEGQMDETANVVRLMTIHQAKGLEFPVVIIPDLHREPNRREAAFILDRHKGMTVRVPDGRGRSVRGALFNELGQRNRWREEFESMRLLYVAATRAEDRLILSSAIDRKGLENLTKTDREQWLAWIWRALNLDEQAQSGVMNLSGEAQIQITIDRESPEQRSVAAPVKQPVAETTIDSSRSFAETFPLLQSIAPESGQLLRRFTVTQLLNFQRCPRQYYFERLLRTPGKDERAIWNDAEAPEPPANLTATLKGAVIHRFCETFSEGDSVEARLTASFEDVLSQRQAELVGRAFDINKTEAVRALTPLAENYLSSDVFRRVVTAQVAPASAGEDAETHRLKSVPQAPGLWSELRFRLRRPLGILTGTIDKLLISPANDGNSVDVEIIDFKTNRFSTSKQPIKRVRRASASIRTTTAKGNLALPPGQTHFDFEAVAEEVLAEEVEVAVAENAASVEEQIRTTANDYQLQMQAYALALRELVSVRTAIDGDRVRTASGSDRIVINSLRATLHFIDPNIEVSLPASLLDQDTCARSIDDAMSTIAALDGTLDADSFPPTPATHCRMCKFVDLCAPGRDWLRGITGGAEQTR
jgi:ATP-dependent helicase/nuclease subunit A